MTHSFCTDSDGAFCEKSLLSKKSCINSIIVSPTGSSNGTVVPACQCVSVAFEAELTHVDAGLQVWIAFISVPQFADVHAKLDVVRIASRTAFFLINSGKSTSYLLKGCLGAKFRNFLRDFHCFQAAFEAYIVYNRDSNYS